MAYEDLKKAIKQAIKQNDNQEITGNLLQSTLLNVVNTIGADYKFLGFATPSTVPPASEEGNLFYFAITPGNYSNFRTSTGNLVISVENGIFFFTKNATDSYWNSNKVFEIVQTTGNAEDKAMSQKAVSDKLSDLASKLFGIQVFTASKSPTINNIRIFDNVKNGDKLTFRAEMSVDSYDMLYLGLYNKTTGAVTNVFKSYAKEYRRKSVCDSLVVNDSRISGTVKLCINAYTGDNRYVENCVYSIGDNMVLSTLDALKFDKSDVVQTTGNAENKVMSQKAVNNAISNIGEAISNIDKAISNIGKLYIPISFLQNKIVDENLYNRLLISVYGDSIMGAQLDELDDVDGLKLGNFPPNMHKKTHIWQLYNKYKLENEDTEFINLANAKWNKTGFSDTWINHFNKFEAYNPIVDNAEATITITGYKYFKLIWYQCYAGEHSGIITISVDGNSYKKPSELRIDLPDELPIADFGNKINSYAICKLDKTKSYNIKIHMQKKSVNLAFWGCEVWNNPRIDFVNEAISGITAFNLRKTIGDTLIYNKYHKPLLAIYECLFINDSSYVKNSDHTLSDWLKSNNEMIDLLKSKGIPILGILAHGASTIFLTNYAKGIFINNDIYYIDIQESIKEDKVYIVSNKDGLHLSQKGNNYYFDKIDKVLSYKF